MSVKEIKALVHRLFDEYNKGKAAAWAVADEVCTTDFVLHSTEDVRGLTNFKQHDSQLFTAFPDIHFTVEDIIVEGDKVAMRYTMTGTHKGEFKGIPPTNKKITALAIEIDHIVDGKFAEAWVQFDTLALLQQLGLAPTTGKGR